MLILECLFAGCLAFVNGANDSGKGVATLACSGELPPRAALRLAVLATLIGALAAVFFGAELRAVFRGQGLIPGEAAAEPGFLAAVALAAASTVALATWLRLPVSTSHALLGGLLGAALAGSWAIDPSALLRLFVLPLLLSPALAALLGLGVATLAGCLASRRSPVPVTALRLVAAPASSSRPLHLLSAGATSFARGFQDTPKIAALLAFHATVADPPATVLAGVAMAAGGLLAGARVARRVSRDLCSCVPAQGCGANLVAAALVLGATPLGLPVSTTHVTCGCVAGAGLAGGRLDRRLLASFAMAWLVTLPAAALLAALTAPLLRASL